MAFADEGSVAAIEKLLKACEEGDFDEVEEMIGGGEVSATCSGRNYPKPQPIHVAATEGHMKIVKYLLEEQGVDIGAKDREDWTPFLCACDGGHLEIAKYLEEAGADIHVVESSGENAVHRAAANGELEVLQWLVSEDVAIDLQNDDGKTAEELGEEHPDIVQFFKSRMSLAAERAKMSLKEFQELKRLKEQADAKSDVESSFHEKEAIFQKKLEEKDAEMARREAELRDEFEEKLEAKAAEVDKAVREELELELQKKDEALAAAADEKEGIEAEVRRLHVIEMQKKDGEIQSAVMRQSEIEAEFKAMTEKALKARDAHFEAERHALEEAFARKIKLKDAAVKGAESERGVSQRKVKKLEAEILQMREDLQAKTALAEKLGPLQQELEKKKSLADGLAKELESTKKELDKLSKLDVVKLQKRLRRRDRSLRKISRESVVWSKAAGRLKEAQEEIAALKAELAGLKGQ